MKKLITLIALLFALKVNAQLSVQIIGNNECRFPYNDNESITLKISGLKVGQWYEIAFPTNYIEGHPKPEITREVALYFQLNNGFIEISTQAASVLTAGSSLVYDGETMQYLFNGIGSVYSDFSTLTQWYQGHPGWHLPPNTNPKQYYLSVRPFNSNKSAVAYFSIIP